MSKGKNSARLRHYAANSTRPIVKGDYSGGDTDRAAESVAFPACGARGSNTRHEMASQARWLAARQCEGCRGSVSSPSFHSWGARHSVQGFLI